MRASVRRNAFCLAVTGLAALASLQAARAAPEPDGLKKIQHLIFIVQENRSFDSYFGTYPGADGIPSPLPCLPSSDHPQRCYKPFLTHRNTEPGGPYTAPYQTIDVDGGKMDGFIIAKEQAQPQCQAGASRAARRVVLVDPEIGPQIQTCDESDVMAHHDGTDLPNYWAYAQNFVLFDHFYESIESWSLPSHLAIFSGWAAVCSQLDPPNVDSCANSGNDTYSEWLTGQPPPYLWTDITYLLWQHDISWTAYLDNGLNELAQPPNTHPPAGVLHLWDVLPGFETVNDDGQVGNAEVDQKQFFKDAAAGTLPQVSWLLPQEEDSEHPPYPISKGVAYTTRLIDAVMQSPDWNSSAIFMIWDDMGGFYDNAPPPFSLDSLGPGIRLPALLISPYARPGLVDHAICSSDCFLMLIEDTFLDRERISEAGRPDPRPDYRDQATEYGHLTRAFDFKQTPRPPLLLSPHPMSLLRDGNS